MARDKGGRGEGGSVRSKHAVSLFIERRLKAFTRRSCSKVRISLANCLIYDRRFDDDDDDDTRPSFGFV